MDNNTRWQDFNSIARSKELKTTEKALLLVIFSYNSFEKGYSYPSISKLMLETPIKDKTTFLKSRNSLVEKGYLRFETVKGKECHYFISIPGSEIIPGGKITHDSETTYGRKITYSRKTTPSRGAKPSWETKPSGETKPSWETTPTPGGKTIPIPGRGTIPQKEKKRIIKENIYSEFDSYTENEELKITLKDFAEMRRAIKKPLTTKRAIIMLINKLDSLASTDEEKKLILEQSIFNNWQGVFELKGNKQIQIQRQISINDNGIRNFG